MEMKNSENFFTFIFYLRRFFFFFSFNRSLRTESPFRQIALLQILQHIIALRYGVRNHACARARKLTQINRIRRPCVWREFSAEKILDDVRVEQVYVTVRRHSATPVRYCGARLQLCLSLCPSFPPVKPSPTKVRNRRSLFATSKMLNYEAASQLTSTTVKPDTPIRLWSNFGLP